jgi:hypothetical protein
MNQLGILYGEDESLCFFRIAAADRKCLRVSREWMETKDGARDNRERAKSAGNEFGEIVARDILHDFASAGGESTVGKSERDADDQVAEGAEAEAQRAAVVR